MEIDFPEEVKKAVEEFFNRYKVEMWNRKIKGVEAAADAAAQDMVERFNEPRRLAANHILLLAAKQYFKGMFLERFKAYLRDAPKSV
jgi:hypothetical protein